MKTAATSIVHLICTLSLILPQGWCCLPAPAAAAAGPAEGESRPQPSRSCCHQTPAPDQAPATPTKPGDQAAHPHDGQQPHPVNTCECGQKQITPQRSAPDLTFALAPAGPLFVPVISG